MAVIHFLISLLSQVFDMLLNGDIFPYPTYFYNITGSTNYFNILKFTVSREQHYILPYMELACKHCGCRLLQSLPTTLPT